MENIIITYNNKAYKRINKTAAKSAFINGGAVYVTSCNFTPFTPWSSPAVLDISTADSRELDRSGGVAGYFNKFINDFEWYNCINSETGRRAAFYVETENPAPEVYTCRDGIEIQYYTDNNNVSYTERATDRIRIGRRQHVH